MRRNPTSRTHRLIIYRLGSIGDTIAALPCFHLIERAFPAAERLALTNIPVSAEAAPLELVLRNGGFVHGSIAYPVGLREATALSRLALAIRQTGAHTLVYLAAGRSLRVVARDFAYFRLCGFERIVGMPIGSDLRRNRVDAAGQLEPESHRLGRTLRALGPIDFSDRRWWDLRLTSTERTAAYRALGRLGSLPFLALNTGGKAAQKDWGEQNWLDLLVVLRVRMQQCGLVFIGGDEDSERAGRLGRVWTSGPVLDLSGALTPRESAAAIARAAVFVGHDSGPIHLADAVGTPCVGLFGSYNRPRMWHPTGRDTHVIHRTAGLASIGPSEVADAVGAAIPPRPAYPVVI